MELQHINVKLYLENSKNVDLEALIPVFHNWIQDQICEELLIDVADYRHVHAGPGMVLIGHEADFSVDNTDCRLGIRYNRKATLGGSNEDRLNQALRAALIACQRLESDARLEGTIRFDRREMQLFINDRLIAPNLEDTYTALKPELEVFFQKLFEGNGLSLKHNRDPRSLLSVAVKATKPLDLDALLKKLTS